MAESPLLSKSKELALAVIRVCNEIRQSKRESVLTNQLIRFGTSVGANIRKAFFAHNRADFIAKLQIALKECYETEYWLELFVKAEILDRERVIDLYNQCGTIRRMLIASINTAKGNKTDCP